MLSITGKLLSCLLKLENFYLGALYRQPMNVLQFNYFENEYIG